jgi:MFS family permease
MFGVSQIVGALMMYGIGGASMAIATWRVMFILCGGLTVVCGTLFILFMPRDTTTAWFLNESERRVATERLALDHATRDRTNFDLRQVREAFTDYRTVMYALMALTITMPTAIVKVEPVS